MQENITGAGFPISHLSSEIKEYINKIAEQYQVDHDMVTLGVYVSTAVSAGCRVTTWDGTYRNKLNLWAIVLGISGAGKSEYLNKVLEPLLMRNKPLVEEYERAMNAWNGKGKEPEAHDFRIHSITLEALIEKINLNPDGLLLYRPELSGWVGGFGKYNKDESEYATWIELWDGKSFPFHTKNGTKKLINAKDPVLSVVGGVQPHIMKRFARADILGSGFLGRLLMVYPPLCYPTAAATGQLDGQLLGFWSDFINNNYNMRAEYLFTADAKAIYDDFCFKYVREKVLEIGENAVDPFNVCMLEFFGKIKIYAEKWAGLSMMLSGRSGFIDADIMTMTIEAMKVFEAYAKKVYSFIFGGGVPSGRGELVRKVNEVIGIRNQKQFGESLGLSRTQIGDYLNGRK